MPSYSGVWNLVAVYQAVGAGQWSTTPVGFLLKFSNTESSNNIQAEVSPIDTSTGISYCTFNYLSGGRYGIRIAAVTSNGTVKWAKSYSVSGNDVYATDASQNGTHIFIAARGSGNAVVLKISKSDGSLTASKTLSASSSNVGLSVDYVNNRFYFQYTDGSTHRVGCFNADTFAAIWSPLSVTYGGSYPAPVSVFNVDYNHSNGIAYGFFNRYNSGGTIQESHVIGLNSSGVSFVQNIAVGLRTDMIGATFDASNNIIVSGDKYLISYNSSATSVNWGRNYTFSRQRNGISENGFSNNSVYPFNAQGIFLQFNTASPSISWSKILETGATASDREAYTSGAVEYQNYVTYCMFEDSFATGKNAYVMNFPKSGSYTGLINSSAEVVAGSTTSSSYTPTLASITPTTSSSGTSFSDYTVTTTTWSPTTTLTLFA